MVTPSPAELAAAPRADVRTAPDGPSGGAGISLRGLRKTFGSAVAVDHVDLDIPAGEFFSMLGPSGSGKTTVLRMIAGFEQPTAGAIHLDGVDVTKTAPFGRDVNTVFQDYALFPHMSVRENVEYGLRVKKVRRAERRERALEALARVRLDHLADRKPGQLSGGQRQRVALARALVNRPRVLLLDEPLGALDLKLRREMQVELKEIQREVGITFIFVTHDQEEALTLSDRIAIFNEGRIQQIATPEELYERPATAFVAGFVGTSNLLEDEQTVALLGHGGTYNLRPERIRLHRSAAAAASPTPHDAEEVAAGGVVREVIYLGSATQTIVDLDAGGSLIVLEQNALGTSDRPATHRGDRVVLTWRRADCVAVAPPTESSPSA
ncbi:ABC transporter ATP-binding protein [Nocardioides sp. GY 10113]|uniref:ABC transporter ATP-binding protein n=1 Tax=Nocardioides sp. GY 10113 TaxID=2569761 RepID=UPI0010A90199|nr:ABC transporter ATP-binding protein [Nocardioides sp. GY 10113]TIC87962.1 ABC transporter ATP-binding protein [Nocardioides sp. GY 10113]